jgi:hypothetical protein
LFYTGGEREFVLILSPPGHMLGTFRNVVKQPDRSTHRAVDWSWGNIDWLCCRLINAFRQTARTYTPFDFHLPHNVALLHSYVLWKHAVAFMR